MRRNARLFGGFRDAERRTARPLDRPPLRWRFWIEAGTTFVAGVVAVLTVLALGWAEVLFDIDPDQGSGLFEVAVTVVAVHVAVACALAARVEWRGHMAGERSQEIDGGAA